MPIGDGTILRGAIKGALKEVPIVGMLFPGGAPAAQVSDAGLDKLADALANRIPALAPASPPAKPWWQSLTIQSVAAVFVGGILAKFGYQVAPEDVSAGIDQIGQILFLLGSLGAIWGRTRAKRPVK